MLEIITGSLFYRDDARSSISSIDELERDERCMFLALCRKSRPPPTTHFDQRIKEIDIVEKREMAGITYMANAGDL